MAHVEKQRDGSYTIVIEAGKDPQTGKRKRITRNVRVDREREAKKIMHQMVAEIENGTYISPNNITVAQFLHMWLRNKKFEIAERTYSDYKSIIDTVLIPPNLYILMAG